MSLRIALIHSVIARGEAARNREALRERVREAGRAGARIVVAPELACSGYGFPDREAALALAETPRGPGYRALAPLCREHRLFCCFGFIERDPASGLLFNAALVIGPEGEPILRYRKINAEGRWAVPGDPRADNTFATPWGRAGLLICSDSYHALMPRMTALRGARLLLVPANWPPSGLDPLDIWRARALENGMYVAACNCGGMNGDMDCAAAVTALVAPDGRVVGRASGGESRILYADIELTGGKRLPGRTAQRLPAGRNPAAALDCAPHLSGIGDWTGFRGLPAPGPLAIRVGAAPPRKAAAGPPCLHILVLSEDGGEDTEDARLFAALRPGDAALVWRGGRVDLLAAERRRALPWNPAEDARPQAPPLLDCGPARLAVMDAAALRHPEHALARAKQGCDLLVFFRDSPDEASDLLARARVIEQAAVLFCTRRGGALRLPPKGHEPLDEQCWGPEGGAVLLDTHDTRSKRFQDLIDYPALLRTGSGRRRMPQTETGR